MPARSIRPGPNASTSHDRLHPLRHLGVTPARHRSNTGMVQLVDGEERGRAVGRSVTAQAPIAGERELLRAVLLLVPTVQLLDILLGNLDGHDEHTAGRSGFSHLLPALPRPSARRHGPSRPYRLVGRRLASSNSRGPERTMKQRSAGARLRPIRRAMCACSRAGWGHDRPDCCRCSIVSSGAGPAAAVPPILRACTGSPGPPPETGPRAGVPLAVSK